MMKIFKKTVKTGKNLQKKKLPYAIKIWQKFLCHWMQLDTLKPHSITVSGGLELYKLLLWWLRLPS
jgi:hypothetical protein